jgi:hypothetical protein
MSVCDEDMKPAHLPRNSVKIIPARALTYVRVILKDVFLHEYCQQ